MILGFAPTTEIVTNPDMLYLALGILGATVMPHNLYLHSGIVQTREIGETIAEKREALKFATLDSTIALMFALLINASILILAAATFNKAGRRPLPNSAKPIICWHRCSALPSRRRCSAWRFCAAASIPPSRQRLPGRS